MLVAPSSVSAAETERASAEDPMQTFASVTIVTGGETFSHPGFFAYVGEESVFSFTIGGKQHDVVVGIKGDEEKGYDLHVVYKRAGHVVLSGDGHVAAGGTHEITRGAATVKVHIDPHGAPDKGRKKKIEGPGGDDPLG
jgi:hypothetical protein